MRREPPRLPMRPVSVLLLCSLVLLGGTGRAEAQATGGPQTPGTARLLRLDYPDPVPLQQALLDLAAQANLDLIFAHRLLDGLETSGVWQGTDAAEGLGLLLEETGLLARPVDPRRYVLVPGDEAPRERPPPALTGPLEGRVVDAETDMPLPGAHVLLVSSAGGAATDFEGRFRVDGVRQGTHEIRVSYVGYRAVTLPVEVYAESPALPTLVRLRAETVQAGGVEVEQGDDPGVGPGVDALGEGSPESDVAALPAFLGEPDLFQSLEGLPGVQRSGEAGGELVVRSAEGHYNRYLLDGAPLVSPFHTFGLFSTFQPETVRAARLHKGTLSAEHGSALAAVLEVESTDGLAVPGRRRRAHGAAAISPVAVRAVVEAPLGPRVGLVVSGRRSYLDLLLAPSLRPTDRLTLNASVPGDADVGFGFYDAGGKLTWRPRAGRDVSVSLYRSADRLETAYVDGDELDGARIREGNGWSNTLFAARHRALVSRALFLDVAAYHSRYVTSQTFQAEPQGEDPELPFSLGLFIDQRYSETGLRADADYFRSLNHHFRFGLHLAQRLFANTLQADFRGFAEDVDGLPALDERQVAGEVAAYVQDAWRPSRRWLVQPGLRAEAYQSDGAVRLALLPRLHVRYAAVPERLFVHGGGSVQRQTLHRLRDPLSTNQDVSAGRWLPAGDAAPPARARHLGAGIEWLPAPAVALTADVYARLFDDVQLALPAPDDDGELSLTAADLLTAYAAGRERSVGGELGARWARGVWAASGAYAWSRTRAQVTGESERPGRYDVPHRLVLVGQRRGRSASGAAALTVRSGRPMLGDGFAAVETGRRLPLYVRLDLALGYRFPAFGLSWEAQAQAYNATGRANTVSDGIGQGDGTSAGLPLLPMLSLKASW